MAKNATKGSGAGSRKASDKTSKAKGTNSAPRKTVAARTRSSEEQDGNGAADMFVKLLQSPIVADLLAVAATAALAALAEHGFNSRGASGDGKRASRAMKEAGKAAAAAIGRRLATEMDEIRKAAKGATAGA